MTINDHRISQATVPHFHAHAHGRESDHRVPPMDDANPVKIAHHIVIKNILVIRRSPNFLN